MRLLLFVVVGSAAACATQSVQDHRIRPVASYIVEPGAVTRYAPNNSLVSATFTLKLSNAGSTSSLKTGGACLVYQKGTQDICPTGDPAQCPELPDTSRYCIGEPNIAQGHVRRTCWYKPLRSGEETSCNKQPILDMTLNVMNQTPLVSTFPATPVSWRVVTCHNVVPGGCASGKPGESTLRYGPVAQF